MLTIKTTIMTTTDETKRRMYSLFETACDGVYDIEPIINCGTFTMGLIKLDFDLKTSTLHVYLRRPGLLIGRAGENIKKLEEWLECKIRIHEVRELGMF